MDEPTKGYNPWDVPGIGDVAMKGDKRREVVEVFVHSHRVTYLDDSGLHCIKWPSWWSWCYDATYTAAVAA